MVFVGGSMAMSVHGRSRATAKSLRRLASFVRLVTYDQQGMGYSDRMDLSVPPTMEDLVADLKAVIAASGLTEPLFGTHNGGTVAALYATRHPVRQLILCNAWARVASESDDFPIGFSRGGSWTRWRIDMRPSGAEGRSPTSTRRAEATNHRAYEFASTSHNQLGHLFEMNRTSTSAPPCGDHSADPRHPPGGQPEHSCRPR